MAGRNKSTVLRGAAGILTAAVLLSVPAMPASAAGLFESFFGDLGRILNGAPTQARAYAGPSAGEWVIPQQRVIESGPAGPRRAFCVRTCDGSYFPVRAHAGLSVADACHSFCPACETRLYYGSSIDQAVAQNGSRYTDLPNAYLYRKQMTANCSCNGRSVAGLTHLAPQDDPTLRPGDVVATTSGLVVYTGGRGAAANFTPVKSYAGFSKSERATLLALKVTPPDRRGTAEAPVTPPAFTAAWRLRGNRTAQR